MERNVGGVVETELGERLIAGVIVPPRPYRVGQVSARSRSHVRAYTDTAAGDFVRQIPGRCASERRLPLSSYIYISISLWRCHTPNDTKNQLRPIACDNCRMKAM
jgi:hypothetical protein